MLVNKISKQFAIPEDWCQEDTNISNMNRDVEETEGIMYASWGDHKARVDCATHNTAKRVPCSLIKPVEKIVEAMFYHVRCGSVVEPEHNNTS